MLDTSTTNALTTAQALKEQADDILLNMGIDKLLRACGQVLYIGSYALDLMAWPDIDIHLLPHSPKNSDEQLLELGKRLVNHPEVITIKFEKNFNGRFANCPQGSYLQLRLNKGNWQLPWKLDIWAIDKDTLAEDVQFIEQVKQSLNPALRQLILKMKQSLLTAAGRTPPFSGYQLYQAILFKGLRDEQQIRAYLQAQGIEC